mgnify:CR=1 FL=1
MTVSETRRDIYSYLDFQTREFDPARLERFTTQDIASAVSVSRNLASQYLNDLVREGLVVKVGTRPLYYLHRHNIERYLQTRIEKSSYQGIDELLALRGSRVARNFERAVGHDLSLTSSIERMRVAMGYPPSGLPVLIMGASGTGKTYLAKLMLEYGKDVGLLGPEATLLAVDCARYMLNPERIVGDYLGSGGEPGLIEKGKGGLLLFKNIDALPIPQQEYLFSEALFAARAEQGSPERGLRLVFSSTLPPDSARAGELRHRLPVVVRIPSLKGRTLEERTQIALRFLKDEGRRMGVDVFVSKGAFSCLVNATYEDNISELRRSITNACAEAYLFSKGEGRIVVRTYCLPAFVLAGADAREVDADGSLVDTTRCSELYSRRNLQSFVDPMVERYEALGALEGLDGKKGDALRALRQGLASDLSALESHFARGSVTRGEKLAAFEGLLESGIEGLNRELGLALSPATARLIAQLSYMQIMPEDGLRRWKAQKRGALAGLLALLRGDDPAMAKLADRLVELDFRLLGIELDGLGSLLVFLHVLLLEDDAARR